MQNNQLNSAGGESTCEFKHTLNLSVPGIMINSSHLNNNLRREYLLDRLISSSAIIRAGYDVMIMSAMQIHKRGLGQHEQTKISPAE
jgi:hypothetical protein